MVCSRAFHRQCPELVHDELPWLGQPGVERRHPRITPRVADPRGPDQLPDRFREPVGVARYRRALGRAERGVALGRVVHPDDGFDAVALAQVVQLDRDRDRQARVQGGHQLGRTRYDNIPFKNRRNNLGRRQSFTIRTAKSCPRTVKAVRYERYHHSFANIGIATQPPPQPPLIDCQVGLAAHDDGEQGVAIRLLLPHEELAQYILSKALATRLATLIYVQLKMLNPPEAGARH